MAIYYFCGGDPAVIAVNADPIPLPSWDRTISY